MKKPVPFSPTYSADTEGNIYSPTGEKLALIPGRKGSIAVRMYLPKWGKTSRREAARVILATFDPRGNEKDLSVGYKDGDRTNLSLENIYWDEEWYIPKDIPGVTMPTDTFPDET